MVERADRYAPMHSDTPRSRRLAGGRSRPWVAWCTFASLAVCVVASVLALGAIHLRTLLIVTPFAIASAIVSLGRTRASLPWAAVVCFVLGYFSLLQALPMPSGVVRVLSPEALDVWTRAGRFFAPPGGTWHPLSLAPANSIAEGLKWTAYGAVVCASSATCHAFGRRVVVRLLFVSGVVVASVTLLHGLAGSQRLYGLYQPSFAHSRFGLSPLLNPNSLAGYLNLTAFAGLGLFLDEARQGHRIALAVGLVLTLTVGLLTASRGGVLGTIVGLALLGASAQRMLKQRRGIRWFTVAALPALLAVAFLVGAFAMSEHAWKELLDTDTGKLSSISSAVPFVVAFPIVGAGRGAFHSVFPHFRPNAGTTTAQYIENFPMHWAAEWGVLVTMFAVVAFYLSVRPSLGARTPTRTTTTLAIGFVVLLLQNMADLALELPGVSIAAAVALGTFAYQANRLVGLRARPIKMALCACLVAPYVFALAWARPNTNDERQVLWSGIQAAKTRESLVLSYKRIADDLRYHPADPYTAYVAGVVAERLRSPVSLSWLAYSLERDPGNGRTHLALAHALKRRQNLSQAILHLRHAATLDTGTARDVAISSTEWTDDISLLRQAVPEGPAGTAVLYELARANKSNADTFIAEGLARAPTDAGLNRLAAQSLIDALRASRAPCAEPAQTQECLDRVRRYIGAIPAAGGKLSTKLLSARALAAAKQPKAAYAELATTCSELGSATCWREAVVLASEARDHSSLASASSAYLAHESSSAAKSAAAAHFLGDVHMSLGSYLRALEFYSREVTDRPTPQSWRCLAAAAEKTGQIQRAEAARQRAAALDRVDSK